MQRVRLQLRLQPRMRQVHLTKVGPRRRGNHSCHCRIRQNDTTTVLVNSFCHGFSYRVNTECPPIGVCGYVCQP